MKKRLRQFSVFYNETDPFRNGFFMLAGFECFISQLKHFGKQMVRISERGMDQGTVEIIWVVFKKKIVDICSIDGYNSIWFIGGGDYRFLCPFSASSLLRAPSPVQKATSSRLNALSALPSTACNEYFFTFSPDRRLFWISVPSFFSVYRGNFLPVDSLV